MAKFILTFKGAVIREYEAADIMGIGRRPDNTICIDNMAVSGMHAKIERKGDEYMLTDLNSRNGTYVNGKRISQVTLKANDQIAIGKHILVLKDRVAEGKAVAPEEEEGRLGDTMFIDMTAQRAAMGREDAEAAAVAKAAEPLAIMTVIPSSGRPMEVELRKKITVIGKGEGADIEIKGFFVGKRSAMISRRPQGYFITQIEGMTKVKLNGEPLKANHLVKLSDGDNIEVGGVRMIFTLK